MEKLKKNNDNKDNLYFVLIEDGKIYFEESNNSYDLRSVPRSNDLGDSRNGDSFVEVPNTRDSY